MAAEQPVDGVRDPRVGPSALATETLDRGRQARAPREIPWLGWKDVLWRVYLQFDRDHLGILAGGVAFYAALSLFPLLAMSVTLYGLFVDPATTERHLREVWTQLPPSAAQLVSDYVRELTKTARTDLSFSLVVSFVLTLYTGSKGIDTMLDGIHIAYDEGRTRPAWRQKLLAIALTVGALCLGLPTLALNTGLTWIFDGLELGTLGRLGVEALRVALFISVLSFALAALYRYAPNRARAKWRWLAPGALVAATLWAIGSAGFSFYVARWGTYSQTYSSFAGVFVLLLWLYLSAFVILLGAELNAELEAQTTVDTTRGAEKPMGQRGAKKADVIGEARQSKTPEPAEE